MIRRTFRQRKRGFRTLLYKTSITGKIFGKFPAASAARASRSKISGREKSLVENTSSPRRRTSCGQCEEFLTDILPFLVLFLGAIPEDFPALQPSNRNLGQEKFGGPSAIFQVKTSHLSPIFAGFPEETRDRFVAICYSLARQISGPYGSGRPQKAAPLKNFLTVGIPPPTLLLL